MSKITLITITIALVAVWQLLVPGPIFPGGSMMANVALLCHFTAELSYRYSGAWPHDLLFQMYALLESLNIILQRLSVLERLVQISSRCSVLEPPELFLLGCQGIESLVLVLLRCSVLYPLVMFLQGQSVIEPLALCIQNNFRTGAFLSIQIYQMSDYQC